jgi:rare lipoprotein A (peptidoglycan hydrolase)
VEVVVNDYGPTRSDRMFDVTYAAAVQLDFIDQGLIDCKIETI